MLQKQILARAIRETSTDHRPGVDVLRSALDLDFVAMKLAQIAGRKGPGSGRMDGRFSGLTIYAHVCLYTSILYTYILHVYQP